MTTELTEFTKYQSPNTTVVTYYMDVHMNARPLDGSISVVPMRTETQLKLLERGVDLKQEVANFMQNNIRETMGFPRFSKNGVTGETLVRRVRAQFHMASNWIATDGRINVANTIVMNSKMAKEYYNVDDGWILAVNEFVQDDTFYLINNTGMDQPGYKFLFCRDIDNQELYYAITKIGHTADKHAVKFVIYE